MGGLNLFVTDQADDPLHLAGLDRFVKPQVSPGPHLEHVWLGGAGSTVQV